jgi:hypothetical protein
MNRRSRDRGTQVRPFLTLAALGLAVFLWGLHYKISKYDLWGPDSPRPIPVKLLSQSEQPLQEGSQFNRHHKAIGTVLMFAPQTLVWLFFIQQCLRGSAHARPVRTIRVVRRVRPSTGLTIFFFRPPPPILI